MCGARRPRARRRRTARGGRPGEATTLARTAPVLDDARPRSRRRRSRCRAGAWAGPPGGWRRGCASGLFRVYGARGRLWPRARGLRGGPTRGRTLPEGGTGGPTRWGGGGGRHSARTYTGGSGRPDALGAGGGRPDTVGSGAGRPDPGVARGGPTPESDTRGAVTAADGFATRAPPTHAYAHEGFAARLRLHRVRHPRDDPAGAASTARSTWRRASPTSRRPTRSRKPRAARDRRRTSTSTRSPGARSRCATRIAAKYRAAATGCDVRPASARSRSPAARPRR